MDEEDTGRGHRDLRPRGVIGTPMDTPERKLPHTIPRRTRGGEVWQPVLDEGAPPTVPDRPGTLPHPPRKGSTVGPPRVV